MNAFASIEDANAYSLAGHATRTLESLRSGIHFTYRINRCKDKEGLFFVSLLTQGSADEGTFSYLGLIKEDGFRLTKNSNAGKDAPSVKAFTFFWTSQKLHPELVVRHEGHCGRCGRTLTTPESIERGWGPECRKHMGI